MKCYCCLEKEGKDILNVNGVKFVLCKKCKRIVKKYIKKIKRAS